MFKLSSVGMGAKTPFIPLTRGLALQSYEQKDKISISLCCAFRPPLPCPLGAFGNLQQGREGRSTVLSLSPPIVTLRKSSFLAVCRGIWKSFILHIKPKHLYISMQVLYRQFCVPLLWSVWVTYLRWENMAEHFKLQCFVLNYCDSVLALSGFPSNENQLYSTYWQKYLCPPHTAIFRGDHETARAFVWSQI